MLIVINLVLVLAFFGAVIVVEQIRKTEERLKTENCIQRQIIQTQKEAIQSIRKKQHEYKNNIGTIQALLLVENVKEAKSLLRELVNQSISVDRTLRNKGNFIEILINYKMEEARAKCIRTEQDTLFCYDIPLDEYDIGIVINNAMNNAMEACEKLPIGKRYIKCIMNFNMGYLNFYFENSYNGEVQEKNGMLITAKRNASEHGFGMQNIKEIARKYDGFTSYGVKNGLFWMRCSLKIAEKKSA